MHEMLYIVKETILQQLDAFRTEIQGSLRKLCAFKVSRDHPSKHVATVCFITERNYALLLKVSPLLNILKGKSYSVLF